MRQSSRTETTQLLLSNETCVELRNERFDETAVSTGATSFEGLVECQHVRFDLETTNDRRWPIPNLLFYFYSRKRKLLLELLPLLLKIKTNCNVEVCNPLLYFEDLY